MSDILETDSFDTVETRKPKKKVPVGTCPVSLLGDEKKAIGQVADALDRYIGIRSLSTYNQMLTFHASIQALKAALAGDYAALAGAAQTGLDASADVVSVSPYLLSQQDGAKRNLASEQRAALKEMALRLGQAHRHADPALDDQAYVIRAAVSAAICADRGLMHHLKANLGTILVRLSSEESPHRRAVTWTPALEDYVRRFRSARIQIP